MAGDYHSNSDAMDIDPISETVTNGFEDNTNKNLESPCSSVISLSLYLAFIFPFWEIFRFQAILSFEHGKSYS